MMLGTVGGIFRDGRVELLETPPDRGAARVILAFLPSAVQNDVLPLTVAEAADLRARLHSFTEDLDHPDMDVYRLANGRALRLVP